MVDFDERKIDEIFANLDQCHAPGMAVGIAIRGRPVYRKGFGLASLELPVVLSPTIRMRIGSTTKHFTALAYLLLCEDGKAGLDDLLGDYLPEVHPIARRVTIRQLMANTSGLRDSNDIRVQFSGTTGKRVTRQETLALYRDIDDVNAMPDTNWIYNNGGWVLLSMVIERIADRSFEEAMRERVFEPIGMYDTVVHPWDTDFLPNSATPHSSNREGRLERLYWDMDYAGAGSIVSTINDMLRWAAHMDAPVVGSPAMWSALKANQRLRNGTETDYALGLMRKRYRGLEVLHHPGGGTGCNAQMLKVPEAGLDIVAMSNRGDVNSASYVDKVLDACLPSFGALEDASRGPFATGTFYSRKSGHVIQLFAKDGQQIVSIDAMDQPFDADGDGVLRPAPRALQVRRSVTIIGDPERPSTLRFSDFGNLDELVRVKPVEQPNVAAIAGRYRSDSTGSDVTIVDTDQGPRLHATGRFGSTESSLECLASGIWRTRTQRLVGPPCAILVFEDDASMFRFSNFSTRSMAFRRSI
jgi:CubicO group peptidase (beta-lactamase class C family)